LMSRGIPEKLANQMIIWGYLRETVDSLHGERIKELIEARIEKELSR
jgi:Fe-S cluster assembly protein SufD